MKKQFGDFQKLKDVGSRRYDSFVYKSGYG